jgi:Hint module
MAAQVLTEEQSAVENLLQRRNNLLRNRLALIQGLPNHTPAMSLALRKAELCFPTKEQVRTCYSSCSKLECGDASCNSSSSTCSEPACCRTSTSNGSAIVVTECYNGCCFAVDQSLNFVDPNPCTGAKSKKKKNCFPGGALVELESGVTQRMDRLRVGDRVKVAPGTFSDVFMFTHKLETDVNDFLDIRTACGDHIRLTAGHYIYANGSLVPAGTVEAGDELTLASGARCPVTSVSETVDFGLYNPQTLDGNIVVDGVIASTYTTAVTPTLGHAWLAPLRKLYIFFGLSSRLLENGADAAADCLPSSITANIGLH